MSGDLHRLKTVQNVAAVPTNILKPVSLSSSLFKAILPPVHIENRQFLVACPLRFVFVAERVIGAGVVPSVGANASKVA